MSMSVPVHRVSMEAVVMMGSISTVVHVQMITEERTVKPSYLNTTYKVINNIEDNKVGH